MALSEFSIIDEFFKLDAAYGRSPVVNIGDDCAVLDVPAGYQLAVSTDTLVDGVHFLPDSDPEFLGHKVLAVNLSDLAAGSAEPAWITVSLTIPEFDKTWLASFNKGLTTMAEYFGIQIIGGDTCKGPLSITVQAHGFVPEQVFCRRNTAQAGELVCVTGTLGDAALGLLVAQGKLDVKSEEDKKFLLKRYETPYPRMASGIALRNRATAGIDISDGLLADVNHISQASNVGVLLRWERIPLSDAAKNVADKPLLMKSALSGGDDYELCFSVKEDELEATQQALEMVGSECTAIGRLSGKPGIRVLDGKDEVEIDKLGFKHFG